MDEFERIKELGRGSFGAAILVRRKTDNKRLVVKEVNLAGLSAKEISDARKEANFLANLTHANIVRYEGAFEKDAKLHICMEYCEGGDLSEKIKKQNGVLFGEEQILDWFCQTCLAVRYCHDRKILHRDIKTSNIFLHRHGKQLKLGDFGIARSLDGTTDMAKTCIGTPYYLSPEICEGKPYNARSDVWSLGCVLYEMITLRHAFEAANMRSLVMKIIRGQYPPVNPRFSYELKKLVAECFKREPTKRPSVNAILRKPFVHNCAVNHEPNLNVKSAPTARQAAISKRSKSPEPSKVKKIDAKQRKEQISSAYGQKVIIPRKSKVQHSREERAKRARDQERHRAIQGIQRSVASGISKPRKEPQSSAAEIWDNRNKEILREYYVNKEQAVKNKAAMRGEHGIGGDNYRERIEALDKENCNKPIIMKPTNRGGQALLGSPGAISIDGADRTKTKESVLRKLNEKRWKPGPQGDAPPPPPPSQQHDNAPPPSARKLWESPSKTVVSQFEDLAVNEGTAEKIDVVDEIMDDPKPVFGNTVLIRASTVIQPEYDATVETLMPEKPEEKPKAETQKEVAELRNYFNAFTKEEPEPVKVDEKVTTTTSTSNSSSNKGSILKRLAAKFSPKMSKKEPIAKDEIHEPLDDQNQAAAAVFEPVQVENEQSAEQSKHRESPILIKNDTPDKKYEPSRYSPQAPSAASPFHFGSPKRASSSQVNAKLQTPPPSPALPNFPKTPKRASQSFRLPSPELSKEPAKASEHQSPKPINMCFNQLRGSQSLPDLSLKPEKTKELTMTPHVPPHSLDITHESDSTSPQVIKPDVLNTKTDVTGELVFQPIDGLDTTETDIPEEIMVETLQSGSFQKIELLKPPENPAVNVRSSGEEMMANMQSLLDVEDSINIDDIENDVDSCESDDDVIHESESDENPEDELWESPDSSINGTATSLATITSTVGILDDFDKLEMKREKLELELGIELAVQAYKILYATLDSTSVSSSIETKLRVLLGDHYDNYYPRLMQLVVQDSITYEQVA